MSSTTDMMARPATRPANSVLGSGREAPIQLPDWKRGLADYLKRREEPEPEEPKRQRAAGSTVKRQPVLDLHPRSEEDDLCAGGGRDARISRVTARDRPRRSFGTGNR
jgi:hypothetical protein